MVTEIAFSELDSWLQNQPANMPQTAYELKITGLTADDLLPSSTNGTLGYIIKSNNKYVDLRFTELPETESLFNSFFECRIVYPPVIPEGVIDMGGTFARCERLEEPPVIPNGVISLSNTFASTHIQRAPLIPQSVIYLNTTFYFCPALSETPVIPDGVKYMENCFTGCTMLTYPPAIPDNVKSLHGTFSGCISLLQAPVLPSKLEDLTETFYNCQSLQYAPHIIPKNVYSMNNCFYGCTSLTTVPKEIPENVHNMSGCFYNCTSITEAPRFSEQGDFNLYLGDNDSRTRGAFEGCVSLITVPNIPSRTWKLDRAFYGCTNLTEITSFRANLEEIFEQSGDLYFSAHDAFYGCASLTKIGIPKDVPEESDDWHVMSLKIGASTVEGKIYDRDGNDTDINEGTAVTIEKDNLILPVYTDELMFPPSSMSDADLETLILKVLQYKYTWFKKETIDPENKSFVLWADDPANFKSNVTMDMPVYPTLSALEADLPNLSEGQLVAYEQGGDGLVDAVTNGDMRGVTSNAVYDALNTVSSGEVTFNANVTSGRVQWCRKGNIVTIDVILLELIQWTDGDRQISTNKLPIPPFNGTHFTIPPLNGVTPSQVFFIDSNGYLFTNGGVSHPGLFLGGFTYVCGN